jgi:L-lactate utilization protein LutC
MDDDLIEQTKIELTKAINESLRNYNGMMMIMSADAPIETLCITKKTAKLLRDQGIARIYDLLSLDLTKIEGLEEASLRDLTARFNEFVSMCG